MDPQIYLCDRDGEFLLCDYRVAVNFIPRIGEEVLYLNESGDPRRAKVLNVLHDVQAEQRSLSSHSTRVTVHIILDC